MTVVMSEPVIWFVLVETHVPSEITAENLYLLRHGVNPFIL